MRLLVTGGSGFIGTNLVGRALRAGIPVLNVDVAAPKDTAHAPAWRQCDILDTRALLAACGEFQPTHVVHLAARTDLEEKRFLDGYRVNVQGVRSVLNAIGGATSVQRVVLASSMLVCRNGYRPSGAGDFCPNTLYGESKVLGEHIVRQFDPLDGNWVIVRPTSVWGPWFGTPYREFFETVARRHYRHPGSAAPAKALNYVGNCIQQIWTVLSLAAAVGRRVFYLADNPAYSIREWADSIAALTHGFPIGTVPISLLKGLAVCGDALCAVGVDPPLTTFRLRNMLTGSGFEEPALSELTGALPYSMQSGVEETLNWMRKAGGLC